MDAKGLHENLQVLLKHSSQRPKSSKMLHETVNVLELIDFHHLNWGSIHMTYFRHVCIHPLISYYHCIISWYNYPFFSIWCMLSMTYIHVNTLATSLMLVKNNTCHLCLWHLVWDIGIKKMKGQNIKTLRKIMKTVMIETFVFKLTWCIL